MKRRNVITTLGAATAASLSVVGTGAFTSVSADRSTEITVANDTNALLRLSTVPDSDNADYVETQNGQLTVNISGNNDDVPGDGVNADAITALNDLFLVENLGTQTVYVWILESGGRNGSKRHAFYVGAWGEEKTTTRAISLTDYNNGIGNLKGDGRQRQPQYDAGIETAAVELGVGESIGVGLVVDTPEDSAGTAVLKNGQSMTIHATSDKAELADVFTPVYAPS